MSGNTYYSGLTNEKPSSRVRAPPGGHSNNIFGTDDAAQVNAAKKAQQENIKPISNVFSSEKTDMQKKPNDHMRSNIFGEDQTRMVNNGVNKKRVGYNPITGKEYEEEEESGENRKGSDELAKETSQQQAQPQPQQQSAGVHTSSKVSQPPGGRSTRLW